MYEFAHKGHEFVLRNVVEELFEVYIHDICISVVEVLQKLDNCLLCTSVWSKPIAVVAEMGFHYRRKFLCNCLFYDTVYYTGNSKIADTTVGLRDFHPSHRLWFVLSSSDLVADFHPVFFEIFVDIIDGYPIHSTGALFLL